VEIIYRPEGAEPRSWEFTPRKIMSVDAEAIEAVGGDLWEDFDTFGRLFNMGNRRALRAALWVMLRRDDPGLRFETLSVGAMDIGIGIGEAERERIRELLTTVDDLDPEQRAYFVGMLGEDPRPSDGPKGPSPSDSPDNPTALAPDA
jgi:hypothetical protein